MSTCFRRTHSGRHRLKIPRNPGTAGATDEEPAGEGQGTIRTPARAGAALRGDRVCCKPAKLLLHGKNTSKLSAPPGIPAPSTARHRHHRSDPGVQGRNGSRKSARITGQQPIALPEPSTSPHPGARGTIPFGSPRQYRRHISRTSPWQRSEDAKSTGNRISSQV